MKTSTESVVKKQIGQLIGSFPNANPTSPEIYIAAILFDVLDTGIPDSVVHTTCREIRRTMKFLPTISEFLDVANKQRANWQMVGPLNRILMANRKSLHDALELAQSALAEAKREIAAGWRDEAGKRTGKRNPVMDKVLNRFKEGEQ